MGRHQQGRHVDRAIAEERQDVRRRHRERALRGEHIERARRVDERRRPTEPERERVGDALARRVGRGGEGRGLLACPAQV